MRLVYVYARMSVSDQIVLKRVSKRQQKIVG